MNEYTFELEKDIKNLQRMLPKLEKEIERRSIVQCYTMVKKYLNEYKFNLITKDLPKEYNYLKHHLNSHKEVCKICNFCMLYEVYFKIEWSIWLRNKAWLLSVMHIGAIKEEAVTRKLKEARKKVIKSNILLNIEIKAQRLNVSLKEVDTKIA